MISETNTLRIDASVTYTKKIMLACGQVVKLVARHTPCPFSPPPHVDIDVYRKDNESWVLCRGYVHNPSGWVSRQHYTDHQRPENLKIGTIGGILKTKHEFIQLLGATPVDFQPIGNNQFLYNKIKFEFVDVNQ